MGFFRGIVNPNCGTLFMPLSSTVKTLATFFLRQKLRRPMFVDYRSIGWVVPPPRMPVANEGLGWDPLLYKTTTILVVTGILGPKL